MQGKEQLLPWLQRLDILDFGIMGGEPMINPQWREWVQGVRDIMPRAQIRFTTNGLLLHKASDILDLCDAVGNIVLKITVHVQDAELEHCIQQLQAQRDWRPVREHGIQRWTSGDRVRLQINRPRQFLKPFQGQYHDMMPWHSRPQQAFDRCIQQTCPLLYQGRIYKCSTSALLLDTLTRFGRPNWQHWQPFVQSGLGIEDSDQELQAFLENFGQAHAMCAQCPSQDNAVLDHASTVKFKSRTRM